jgi:hypothetical protein
MHVYTIRPNAAYMVLWHVNNPIPTSCNSATRCNSQVPAVILNLCFPDGLVSRGNITLAAANIATLEAGADRSHCRLNSTDPSLGAALTRVWTAAALRGNQAFASGLSGSYNSLSLQQRGSCREFTVSQAAARRATCTAGDLLLDTMQLLRNRHTPQQTTKLQQKPHVRSVALAARRRRMCAASAAGPSDVFVLDFDGVLVDSEPEVR